MFVQKILNFSYYLYTERCRLVADPLLVPADGVQVGGGGVGRPAEHLQHQRVEPGIIITTMMMMMKIMMVMGQSRKRCTKPLNQGALSKTAQFQ